MTVIALEIAIILLLTLANGVFAMSEMAVVSSRKARLQQRAEEGDAGAQAALRLAETPNRFLSTVQIGVTLSGILAGAFGGATIAEELGARLSAIPALAPYGEAIGLGVVVVSLTYLSLVFGELVPKRLALNNPERIAAAIARPMRALSALAGPVVGLLSASTDAVLRAMRLRPSAEPPVTEEEIKVLIEQGTEAGMFEAAEREMVEGVFRLSDRRVGALMTPRPEIVWLDVDAAPEELRGLIAASGHSRFVVGQGSPDSILGIVQSKDLLARSLAGQPLDLKALLRQPAFVPESLPVMKALELFKQSDMPLALVLDEHGGLQGLVTIHDILEAIVGELPLGGEPEAVRRDDGSWLLDGMLPVDEFQDLFDIREMPEEERDCYQTLGGFVMTRLGRIPAASDHFDWRAWRFEVMDMDGRRVDKVLVTPQAASEPPPD